MGEDEKILRTISGLEDESRALEAIISSDETLDMIHIQRLKKRKSWIKDEIARLHSVICPDIIA